MGKRSTDEDSGSATVQNKKGKTSIETDEKQNRAASGIDDNMNKSKVSAVAKKKQSGMASLVSKVSSNECAIADIAKALQAQTALIRSLCDSNDQDEEVRSDDSPKDQTNTSQENLYGNLLSSLTAEKDEQNIPDELMAILNQSPESEEFGAQLHVNVAESFAKVPNQLLTKETLLKFKESYKVPQNCKIIGVPKVNPEIWSSLPHSVKASDAKQQFLQQNLSRAIIVQARLAEQLVTLASMIPKKKSEELLKMTMDTACILGVAMREVNVKRKFNIKPHIQTEYGGICSAKSEVTEFLFGDNLEQQLKSVKSTSKIIKPPFLARGGSRFSPYKTNFQPKFRQNLNLRAPLFQQRGSGYNREMNFRPRGNSNWRPLYNRFQTQHKPAQH